MASPPHGPVVGAAAVSTAKLRTSPRAAVACPMRSARRVARKRMAATPRGTCHHSWRRGGPARVRRVAAPEARVGLAPEGTTTAAPGATAARAAALAAVEAVEVAGALQVLGAPG